MTDARILLAILPLVIGAMSVGVFLWPRCRGLALGVLIIAVVHYVKALFGL